MVEGGESVMLGVEVAKKVSLNPGHHDCDHEVWVNLGAKTCLSGIVTQDDRRLDHLRRRVAGQFSSGSVCGPAGSGHGL